jgi:hypothetical protein
MIVGRKSDYDKKVKPRLSEIAEWIENGESITQIARRIEVYDAVLRKYAASGKYPELTEILKKRKRKKVTKYPRGTLDKIIRHRHEDITDMISRGITLDIISRELDLDYDGLYRIYGDIVKKSRPGRQIAEENKEKMITMRENGATYRKIGDTVGINHEMARKMIDEWAKQKTD